MHKKIIFSLFFIVLVLSVGTIKANAATDQFVKEAENKNFVLYADQSTLAIKVVDKNSGYTWNSSLTNLSNQGLNYSWQQFVSSAITIDYINSFDKARTTNIASGAQVAVMPNSTGFTANVKFRMAGISLQVMVNLTDTGFEVQVPESSISESTMGRLVDLNLYPFLGATKAAETQGYMLIPDGSGAEISYQDASQMTNAYQANYYGSDYGIATPNVNNSDNSWGVRVPCYGIVNGDDALLSYVKSGAEYGQLDATKAGLQTNFNWITSKFTYRAQYNQPTSEQQTGNGVQMYQQKMNPVNIDIKYDLLSGKNANYTGIAQALQKELVAQDILHKQKTTPPVMNLDYAGADMKPGLFWSSLSVFTTTNDIKNDLQKNGLKNVLPSLFAFTAAGYNASDPNTFPSSSAVGSNSDFQALAKANKNFALDLTYWGTSQPTGIKDTNFLQQINGLNYNAIAPKSYPELVSRDLPSIKALGVKNVTVGGLGDNLDSDYSGSGTNRSQALKLQQEALSELTKAGISVSAYNPNLYAWKYLNGIINLPTCDSFYSYETQSVPFIQNVLKGYITYYSDAANNASDSKTYELENIATGSFPYYLLTQANSSALEKTALSSNFNTTFSNWQSQLKSDYKIYEKVAAATKNATIESQSQLAPDVTSTSYSNGTQILVNQSNTTYTNGKTTVNKRSYQIKEGD